MAVVAEQHVSNSATSGTTIDLDFTGVAVGNVLVTGGCHHGGTGETWTDPSGWTVESQVEGTYQTWTVYTKVATSTSETCTFTWSQSNYIAVVGGEYSGVNDSAPIFDDTDTYDGENLSTPGATGNGGSVTPTTSSGVAVGFFFTWDERRSNCTELSISSPFTEQACAAPGTGLFPVCSINDYVYSSTATLSPDYDSTRTNSSSWDIQTFLGSIKEASGSTTYTKTTSLSGVLQKQDNLKTTSLNAALQKAATLSTSLDAALAKLYTKSTDLDAALQKAFTLSTDLDAALQKAYQLNTSIDAALLKQFEITTGFDALLIGGGFLTTSLDAALQKAAQLGTSLDAALLKEYLLSADFDAALSKSGTLDTSFDAALLKNIELTTSLDAVLEALTGTKTVQTALDAALQVNQTISTSLGAALQKAATKTTDFDAAIQALQTLTTSLDSKLLKNIQLTTGLNAVLTSAGAITITTLLDAVIAISIWEDVTPSGGAWSAVSGSSDLWTDVTPINSTWH